MSDPVLIINLFVPIAVAIIMFAMGLDLRFADFSRAISQPLAVCLAMTGQYVVAPGLAFLLAWWSEPASYIAVGMIIVASVPGGAISNAFVYVGRGNVALSVTLTAISQFFGMISIPLYITWGLRLFYSEAQEVELPVARTFLAVTVVSIAPMFAGMLLLKIRPGIALKIEPRLRVASVVLLFAVCLLAVYSSLETSLSELPRAGVLALTVCGLGIFLGMTSAAVARFDLKNSFTIGIEVGLQNLALASFIAVTLLGRPELAVYAGVYALVSPIVAALVAFGFNWARKHPVGQDALASVPTRLDRSQRPGNGK